MCVFGYYVLVLSWTEKISRFRKLWSFKIFLFNKSIVLTEYSIRRVYDTFIINLKVRITFQTKRKIITELSGTRMISLQNGIKLMMMTNMMTTVLTVAQAFEVSNPDSVLPPKFYKKFKIKFSSPRRTLTYPGLITLKPILLLVKNPT